MRRADAMSVHANGICTGGCDHAEPNAAQVALCRAWLRRWAYPRKSINKRAGSYHLKHRVEESTIAPGVSHEQVDHVGRSWSGSYFYVSNGAFIRAAQLEGYRVVPSAGPNALFNMELRTEPLPFDVGVYA